MILKSRGMAHSNQIREFLLTDHGITLEDVYLGPLGVLTGSARLAQEARERMAEAEAAGELERTRREIERKRAVAEAQIVALRAGIASDDEELKKLAQREKAGRSPFSINGSRWRSAVGPIRSRAGMRPREAVGDDNPKFSGDD